MQFEYEIAVDDYVASQILYHKLSTGRSYVKRAVYCIFTGIFLVLVAYGEWALDWSHVLLAAVGAWWTYAGISALFPGWHCRRAYPGSRMAGKRFQADLDEEGFEVVGDLSSWRVRWPAVSIKGEDKYVFILSDGGTIFMFGKKYLTDEQQRELRRLAALPTHDPN